MSTPALGQQAARIPASGIRALANPAWSHPEAVHLELGEPDFDTPIRIRLAAEQAAASGRTRYTPTAGIPELREAVCRKLLRDNGLAGIDPAQVMVSAGGVGGLQAAYRAILDAGDEILVPDPGWPNLASLALVNGARPVRYALDPITGAFAGVDSLDAVASDRTRAVVVNTPSNPTGATFTDADQRALGEWAQQRGIWVISDECYDQLWFDRPTTTFSRASPETPAVTVFSLSKTYAMTGWRLGYAVGPVPLIERMTRVQETTTSSVNSVTQWAGVEALSGPQDDVVRMRDSYRSRRDRAVETAGRLGLTHTAPSGAFYLWVTLPATVADSASFALELLAARGVAAAPGEAFGPAGRGCLRISLAADVQLIEHGLTELAAFLASGNGHTP